MRQGQKDREMWVSATQLAQMGICERQVVLDHLLGLRLTAEQRTAMRRGCDAHAAFKREADQHVGDAARLKAARSDDRRLAAWFVAMIARVRRPKGLA